jgi:outer membrane protein assembly factor BamD (BamD/ComL family)
MSAKSTKSAVAVLLLQVVLLCACHRKSKTVAAAPPPPPPAPNYFEIGEKDFESAEYASAARAYETYLRGDAYGDQRDLALFHLPGSAVHDAAHATRLLQQLVTAYPQSVYRPQADLLLRLQTEVDHLRADSNKQNDRIKELTKEVEKLNRELEKLREIDLQRRPSRVPPQ